MSGFDIPPIGGLDAMARQLELLRGAAPRLAGQDPERPGIPGAAPLATGDGPSFGGFLAESLARVQGLQDDVRTKTRGLVLGEGVELHDVMIAANKSETAFNLLLEVRNKLVEAWEKLSRSVM